MPMSKEKYEELMSELLKTDLEHSRKTEILQELRMDYGTVHAEFENLTNTNSKLQKDNDDLIVSNSMLFRQAGITSPKEEEQVKEKEFSETITLEALEKGVK